MIEWNTGDKCNVKGWRRKDVGTIKRMLAPTKAITHAEIIIDGQWRVVPIEDLQPVKQYVLKPGNKRRTAKKKGLL